MKKWLSVLTSGLLCATVYSSSPLYANHKFPPTDIFGKNEAGRRVTLPTRTTGAHALQKDGITGKGLRAAIIDAQIFPGHTQKLMKEGVIHPEAISQGFILNPADHIEFLNPSSLEATINFKKAKRESTLKQEKLLSDVNYYNEYFRNPNALTHGSGVMDALHLIAPGAQLIPFDCNKNHMNFSRDQTIAHAIEQAIHLNADVINISQSFNEKFPKTQVACKRAVDKGIAIIFAAGNSSTKEQAMPCGVHFDVTSKVYYKNDTLEIAKTLKGKGICFAGAVRYSSKEGEEKTTTYTSYPDGSLFIFAAGSKLPARGYVDPHTLDGGTSFSAPVLAGAFLLLKQEYLFLKQRAIDQGY